MYIFLYFYFFFFYVEQCKCITISKLILISQMKAIQQYPFPKQGTRTSNRLGENSCNVKFLMWEYRWHPSGHALVTGW